MEEWGCEECRKRGERRRKGKKNGARGRGQCPTKGVMLIYDGDGDLIDRRGDVNLNRWLVKKPSPLSSSLLFDSPVFSSLRGVHP